MAEAAEARRPILRSKRLYLHPMEKDALAATVEWFADPEFAEGFNTRVPESLASVERWLERSREEQGKTRWDFDVRLRDDARCIGFTGLMDVDAVNGSAELVIGIGERSLRDQGYGTEAIKIVLDFDFAELRLHRVGLRVWAFNERAVHVYERMGFVREARYREGHFRHGRHHDIIYMSLLAQEWAAQDRPRSWEVD